MNRNYEIIDGIYLVKDHYELDLHNNFDFMGFNYFIDERRVILSWSRSKGSWVIPETPQTLSVEFIGVSEFRFLPRNSGVPFSEDNCINSIGYLVNEDWADGVIVVEPNQKAEPHWLTAIDFMSGAVIAIQAESSRAEITA
ncbi:hypothetical protein ACOCLD_01985 [Pseudomonas sp. MAC6]|uniref:hypothetical protein n=1 Tax=Pseudomonas sp. MAC6 TaxID=3401633 RepID=UPI003BF541DA